MGRLRLSVQLHSDLKTIERVSIFERTVRLNYTNPYRILFFVHRMTAFIRDDVRSSAVSEVGLRGPRPSPYFVVDVVDLLPHQAAGCQLGVRLEGRPPLLRRQVHLAVGVPRDCRHHRTAVGILPPKARRRLLVVLVAGVARWQADRALVVCTHARQSDLTSSRPPLIYSAVLSSEDPQ